MVLNFELLFKYTLWSTWTVLCLVVLTFLLSLCCPLVGVNEIVLGTGDNFKPKPEPV